MSKPKKSSGPAGSSGKKPSPFADRRVIVLIALLVGIAGYYGYSWWADGAARAESRQKLLADTRAELDKEKPDRDTLSQLMARVGKLPDASTAKDLLAAQAEIELVRNRPVKADLLFGSIATGPSATATDRSLGSRILLAKHQGFGGDVVEARTMLQQAMTMAELAYADSHNVKDLFRAWQASIRLWDERSKDLAQQLAAGHAESPASQVAELNEDFDPLRDASKVADLIVDFAVLPDELRAMQTIVILRRGEVPAALAAAEQHLVEAPGVPGVRFVAAFVLHACAHTEEPADRAAFVQRRNVQLDWLDQHVPPGVPKKWESMRELR